MDNSQDIRTRRANIDKQIIVNNLNEMYNELYQTQGIYRFRYDEEAQIVYIDFGDDEIFVYVKGWAPAEVMRRIFEEVCGHLK